MIPFQAACGDNPEKLFGGQGFRLSVDPDSQMAVFFADAEGKDLLQIEEAAGNILPLFVVNWFDVAPVVLHFLDFQVRIPSVFRPKTISSILFPTIIVDPRIICHLVDTMSAFVSSFLGPMK
jgi:hypothetical protein